MRRVAVLLATLLMCAMMVLQAGAAAVCRPAARVADVCSGGLRSWDLLASEADEVSATEVGPTTKPPAGAVVATRLSDFRNVDDSKVYPRGAGPEIINITEVGPRHFRFVLRHRGGWQDGDRNKNDPKKSRAEVSGLGGKNGPGMRVGETWDIATTVRLDPTFVPSRGYCNIMQPVFDQSYLSVGKVRGDDVAAELVAFTNGIGSATRSVRKFTIRRGQWTSIVVRVKFGSNGSYACSVNGDEFKGVSMDTSRGSQPFRSKWGLYGPTGTNVNNQPLKDLILEHANIYLRKV